MPAYQYIYVVQGPEEVQPKGCCLARTPTSPWRMIQGMTPDLL